MPKTVLIVDDEADERRRLEGLVLRCGHGVLLAASGEEALAHLSAASGESIDAVILDLVMPDLDGMAVLSRLRGRPGLPPIIVQSGTGGIDTVPSALRAGAADFIVKPAGIERVAASLANALRMAALRSALLDRPLHAPAEALEALPVASPAMARARELGLRAARSGLPVLVIGESGTGKRRFAHAVHAASERGERPPVVCGGGDPDPAAFLRAFEEARARNGVLIVSRIEALGPDEQTMLARAFDGGTIGFSAAVSAARRRMRLVATTRRDLAEEVRAGRFREDLYMRLAVQPIPLPALRHRAEDLEDLALRCILRASAETGRGVHRLSSEARALLLSHEWPGNLRELDLVMTRAVMSAETDEIGPEHMPALSGRFAAPGSARAAPVKAVAPAFIPPAGSDFLDADGKPRTLAEIEAEAVRRALERAAGHVGRAAADLGIGRSTLYRKARELGLVPDRPDILLGDAA